MERLWRSVKCEDVYLKNYTSMPELLIGLAEYFVFYNSERFHQALGYKTPDQIYQTGEVGGAKIADYFSEKKEDSIEEMEQHLSTVTEMTPS